MRLIAVPLLVVAALSGCAADKDEQQIASAGGGGKPSAGASAPVDTAAQGLKFAKCMRAEGIEMPDPRPDGMVALPAVPAGAGGEAAAKKTDAALEKCREFMPDGGEPPKPSPEDLAKARDYAKCVRENGIPAFPDPDPETGMFTFGKDATGDLDKLPAATEKCPQFGAGVMPGIGVSQ
jgi:hypothetical protein